eukprot:TRINITY_DN5143_c0_g1_i1.p1 TRINITY_DN5143_c0_g1~~TRINITY_DN5143_c0_g1_i1.p1  ORF type:complete len:632 (+),score=-11.23 TRINITY_DN5143_c0_g1_i1:218-2113(+)
MTRRAAMARSPARCCLVALVTLSAVALVAALPPPRPVQVNHQIWLKGFGPIQGTGCPGFQNVSAFYGVPYANPPVGKLRFAPPVMWDKPYPFPYRRADTAPPKCPQRILAVTDNIKEDCLYMNIFTPANATLGSIAVRVMFHGGWFYKGSASDDFVNGCQSVAETNTTLVVVQYRLGALGFMAHPSTFSESETTGNWGLMDQQMALRWIDKYIPYFGGNGSVEIIGQNAGAISVILHMISPESKGLFTSAVASNGAAIPLFTQNRAYDATYSLAERLNCPINPEQQLACLRQVRWQDLVAKTPVVKEIYRQQNRIFFPCIDGKVIPQQPMDMLVNGQLNPAPLIMVTNKDEGRIFVLQSFPKWWALNETNIRNFLNNIFIGVDPAQIINHYWIKLYNNVLEQYADIWTDIFINCPAYKTMQAVSAYQLPPFEDCAYPSPFYMGYGAPCKVPVWHYYFTVRSPCPASYQFLGATDTRELAYLFNLDSAQTGCSMHVNESVIAYDTTYALGTMANMGRPRFGNDTPWAFWTPDGQTAMVADRGAGQLSYKTIDFATKCAIYDNLVRPPPASPKIGRLSPGFSGPVIPGYPLGIAGSLPSPPPPPMQTSGARGRGAVVGVVMMVVMVVGGLLAL